MKKRRTKEWFDQESFWIDLYPYLFPESRFAQAADEVEKLIQLLAPVGPKVLDLCCGPGRFSVALAQKGFDVTGVDRTPFLLRKARSKARAARVKVEWIQEDMRDFVRPRAFDLVLNTFTSFGYFDDKREDIQVLGNMFTCLRPGGSCLIDVIGKEYLARVYQPTTSDDLPDGSLLVQKHEIFDDWTRIRNEWILLRRGKSRSFRFHHTVYSGQELRDRLELVGFGGVRLYGNFDGDPYGLASERLIAVGAKPESPEQG